jgi:outer membrane lipoprotein-sorting protein
MRFLRTTSTGRLLAALAAVVVVIAGGAAIAVGATGSGTPPKKQSLAKSLHAALTAKPVAGLSAHITFTNGLISPDNFTGGATDPILQGASGRLYVSGDHRMRLELYSQSGDAEIVLNGQNFWISDPSMNTVYEGTLPKSTSGSHGRAKSSADGGVPSVAQIQSDIRSVLGHIHLSGVKTSDPTVVAHQPAYSVTVSPKHSAGLLGDIQLAWDAAHGVPLDIQVHASGNQTPVLELRADSVSYGAQPASLFTMAPPAGEKVVKVATPNPGAKKSTSSSKKHSDVTGVSAVAARVPFALAAPSTVVGKPRQIVKLLDYGGKPAALVAYGNGLGAIAVIEQAADPSSSSTSSSSSSSDPGAGGLSLPTVTITGANHQSLASGQELGTALGTVLRFTHSGVAYTVLGSVAPYAAEQAAAALLSNG